MRRFVFGEGGASVRVCLLAGHPDARRPGQGPSASVTLGSGRTTSFRLSIERGTVCHRTLDRSAAYLIRAPLPPRSRPALWVLPIVIAIDISSESLALR